MSTSVEVLSSDGKSKSKDYEKPNEDVDGWQTVRSRCRRGSTHNLNISTRFHKPSTATSLPALCIDSSSEKTKNCITPDVNARQKRRSVGGKIGKNVNNVVEKAKRDVEVEKKRLCIGKSTNEDLKVLEAHAQYV
jgi:hypothetical protein